MADFTFNLEGKRLLDDRFEVGERITVGGMGAVYSATDHNLDLQVVVKVPHLHFLGEPGFVERFRQEIEGLIRLRHPRIVRILAQGTYEDVPFFVLEHLEGGSLQDRLPEEDGRQPPTEVLAWLGPIASALDFIHEMGVVHRDLKPANILFDGTGNAFLADFGVAKILEGQTSGVTMTGVAVGSPAYMAPEQARGEKVTSASDQYALASTAYEALSGTLPFVGERAVTLRRKVQEEAPPLGDLVADVPKPVIGAVMRALKRDPGDRFDSCGAFAQAFESGLQAPRAGAGPEALAPGDEEQTRSAPVRLPGDWIGVSQRSCGGLSPIWEAREPRTARQRTVCVLAPGVIPHPAASRRVPKAGYASVPRWQSAPADLGGGRILLTTTALRGDALRLPGSGRDRDLADVLAVGRALLELHSIDVAVGLLTPRGILLDRVPDGPAVTFVDVGMDCRAPPQVGAERPAPQDFAWWAPEQIARIHRREPTGPDAWRSDVYFVALAALTAVRGTFPWESEAFESPRVHRERLDDAIEALDVSNALRDVIRGALGPSSQRPTLVELLRAFEGGGAAVPEDEQALSESVEGEAPSSDDVTPPAFEHDEEPPTEEEIVDYVAAHVDARAADRVARTTDEPEGPAEEPTPSTQVVEEPPPVEPKAAPPEPAPEPVPSMAPPPSARTRERRAKPTPRPVETSAGVTRLARISIWVVVGAVTAGLLALFTEALVPDRSDLSGTVQALEGRLSVAETPTFTAHYYWVVWSHWLVDFETLRGMLAARRPAAAKAFAAEVKARADEWRRRFVRAGRGAGRGPVDENVLVELRNLRYRVLDEDLRARRQGGHVSTGLLRWEEPARCQFEDVVPSERQLEAILELTETTAEAFSVRPTGLSEDAWRKKLDGAFTKLHPELLEARIAHLEWLEHEGHDAKRTAEMSAEIKRRANDSLEKLRVSLLPLAHERRAWLQDYLGESSKP